MLRRKKMRKLDQSIDRVHRETLLALKVSEDEIDAVAAAPDLYERVRSRIEIRELEGRHAPARVLPGFAFGFLGTRSLRMMLATAAAILLLAVSAAVLLPRMSQRRGEIAGPGSASDVEASSREIDSGNPLAVPQELKPAASSTKDVARHTTRRNNRHAEVATDYLPLTFTADAPESGHLVRVRVPRSALIAFGLPMNVDRAGEMVKADVFIGDDGLARAIRFVQ